uniref:Thiamine-biosynthesis n=1 Tax=Cyanidium sp. THAL103 TaxID=3027999 RepID=A0A9Y1MYI3_9RHOD|nr:thiamine-biosynthesis [Cyanidium sp. THAL103]
MFMPNLIKLKVNGTFYNCLKNITLLHLIDYLNFNTQLIAVEYNYKVILKNEWGNIYLNNGDKIEIVTIVGGG